MKIERIVITGGRSFTDGARIEADLRALLPFGLRRVAQGGARGADSVAREAWRRTVASEQRSLYSQARDVESTCSEMTYEVNAALDGHWPAAGPRRNIRMLEAERPPLVLAYPDPDSHGTWHCVAAALRMGLTVAVWAPGMRPAEVFGALRFDFPVLFDDEPRFVLAPPAVGREHCEAVAKILRGAAC